VVLKRAALEVEAKHAALFDKKLAQEEVWIRKGVEARRTRNEGRVRALEQLRIQRRERRERIGQVDDASAGGGALGQAGVRSGACDPGLRRRSRHRRFFGAHHARRSHRHHWSQWLRQDHADQAAGGRTGTDVRNHSPRHQLLPAYFDQQRDQLDPRKSIMDNVTGGSGDTVTIDGQRAMCRVTCAIFCFRPSGCMRR
jgi:ATP-binding cassette subfamily F protein uup